MNAAEAYRHTVLEAS